MELLARFIVKTYEIFAISAPYLLLGFFLAGVAHVLLPTSRARRLLGKPGWRGVVMGALLGAPLPLCSCSVIPIAAGLRKQGAGKGATTSFLISTPETGVDSIAVTYGLLDGIMTIFRPLAALVSAIVGGLLVDLFDHKPGHGNDAVVASDPKPIGASPAATSLRPEGPTEISRGRKPPGGGQDSLSPEGATQGPLGAEDSPHDDCCSSCSSAAAAETDEVRACEAACCVSESGRRSWPARIVYFGYVDVLRDVLWALVGGFLASGAIAAILPEDFFTRYLGNEFVAILVMLVVGLPMYVCASASTPIAAAMIAAGLSPGAALVFLLAGPATNVTTMLLVRREMGWRTLAVYLASVALTAVVAGLLLNLGYHTLFGPPAMRVAVATGTGEEVLPAWLTVSSAVILAALLLLAGWYKLRAAQLRRAARFELAE